MVLLQSSGDLPEIDVACVTREFEVPFGQRLDCDVLSLVYRQRKILLIVVHLIVYIQLFKQCTSPFKYLGHF